MIEIILIITLCLLAYCIKKIYQIDNKNKHILETYKILSNDIDEIKENNINYIHSMIINKICSSGMNTYCLEKLNEDISILKYYDVTLGIKYDKYYAMDMRNGKEYCYMSILDYYNQNKDNFIDSLFQKYVDKLTIYIDLYNIEINYAETKYISTHSKYIVQTNNYIEKATIIRLLSTLINYRDYFFIRKNTGRCELLYTNGINDIVINKYDYYTTKCTKYYY